MMMEERKINILGVSETRLKGEGSKIIHGNYRLLFKGDEEHTRHGVGLILCPELANRVEDIVFHSNRLIAVTMKLINITLCIIQVYAPQSGRPEEEKDEFYESLQVVYDRLNRGENKILIIGDLNGHIGIDRVGFENVIGSFGIGNRNNEGVRILDFTVRNNLSVMNTFFKHREQHKWTWYRWNNEENTYTDKSMIDMVIAQDKRVIHDVKSYPSVSMDSDHRLVTAKVSILKPKPYRMIAKKRLRVEKLKDGETKESFQQAISEKLVNQEITYEGVEDAWRQIKEPFIAIAKDILGEKCTGGTKKKQTPWWTETVKTAVKGKMKAFRLWIKQRTVVSRLEYVTARREADTTVRLAKENFWNRLGEELEEDFVGNKKLLYSIAKSYRKGERTTQFSIKDGNGDLLTEPYHIDERWMEYFSELLNVNMEVENEEWNEEIDCEPDISEEEIKASIKKMKLGKAPGADGLPTELYTSAGNVFLSELRKLFNLVWTSGIVPEDWSKALICPIFKKGDRSECKNYRGISLLPHISKIYERILENRLRACVEGVLGEWQYGFRPGRSTTDLVFSLKMLLEKSWEWNLEQRLVFLDLEKAFDSAPRNILWKILEDQEYNVPMTLQRAIRSMYRICKSAVKPVHNEEKWFDVGCGVRQGSVLSPLLFVILMDKVSKRVIARCGDVIHFIYADDVVVISRSEDSLQTAVNTWNDELKNYGLKLNVGKCEVMMVAREIGDFEIWLEGVQLRRVEEFRYLGVHFNEEGLMKREIVKRINAYSREVGMLYPLIKDRRIPKRVKILIYKSILRPVLVYGSEAWSLTSATRSMLQAAEMRVLRMIRGVTRLERLRNVDIRTDLGVESLLDFVEKSQLRWFGHMKRMSMEMYPRRFYEWRPDGRRPRGRPRMRWRDNIARYIEGRGSTIEDIENEEAYEDRQLWRRFVGLSN